MLKDNWIVLRDQVVGLGFSADVLPLEEFEKLVAARENEFRRVADIRVDECQLEVQLYFRLSYPLGQYFLENYEACCRQGRDPAIDRRQTFPIRGGKGVTAREAFNLLKGRSVYKEMRGAEGEIYHAWIRLNFKELEGRQNYHVMQYRGDQYELAKVLSKYPIQELQDSQEKAALIKALEEGERRVVSLRKSKRMEKMYIEANPATRTINIFPVRDK